VVAAEKIPLRRDAWMVILRQGSGVPPDSDKTVLRSRLRPKLLATAGQRATTRASACCRNRLLTGFDALRNRI